MKLPNIHCAQMTRDAGIDAMAALNQGLSDAIVGLEGQELTDLKLVFGKVMAEILLELINPAIAAFPELNLDEATWQQVVLDRAASRAATVLEELEDVKLVQERKNGPFVTVKLVDL